MALGANGSPWHTSVQRAAAGSSKHTTTCQSAHQPSNSHCVDTPDAVTAAARRPFVSQAVSDALDAHDTAHHRHHQHAHPSPPNGTPGSAASTCVAPTGTPHTTTAAPWWRYRLSAVVEHQGASTRSGHYVAYVRRGALGAQHPDDAPQPAAAAGGAPDAAPEDPHHGAESGGGDGGGGSGGMAGDGEGRGGEAPAAGGGGGGTHHHHPHDHWFHVSDTSVREVKLESVLAAQAYLLMYVRE